MIEAHLVTVTEARVYRGAVRDATTLPTFAAAVEAARQLPSNPVTDWHARLIATGQVSSAMALLEGYDVPALRAWVEDFFNSRTRTT